MIRVLVDTLAEWLRRRPAKPLGSARAGSNPAGVVVHVAQKIAVFLTVVVTAVGFEPTRISP